MLGLRSVEEMRQQLRDWLDLSLNHSVPSSLLILSRYRIKSLALYMICNLQCLYYPETVQVNFNPRNLFKHWHSIFPTIVLFDEVGAVQFVGKGRH
jgi:hypothetical protein